MLGGRLFEAFATSGKPDGTGLGLAIVKRILEEHGGELELTDARRGRGARAIFIFPRTGVVADAARAV